MTLAPTPDILPSGSQHELVTLWGVLYNQLSEEEEMKSTYGFAFMQAPSASGQIKAPFQDIPEGHWYREIFTVGKTLGNAPCSTFCLEKEMARCVITY